MIDCIRMYATNVEARKSTRDSMIVGDLELFGIRNSRDGMVYKYELEFQNLKFTFIPSDDALLKISNSLQKAATGNNYMPSKLTDLIFVLESITRLTKVSLDRFIITSMEVGFSFRVPFEVTNFLSNFSYYSTTLPTAMKEGVHDYGVKYYLSHYSIKLYDKSWEVRKKGENPNVPLDIIRVEVNLKRTKLHDLVRVASMLGDVNTLKLLYTSLNKMIDKIVILDSVDTSHLDKRDLMLFFAGENIEYWKRMKSLNNDAQKYLRKKYREIINSCVKKDFKQTLLKCLDGAFEYFMNN